MFAIDVVFDTYRKVSFKSGVRERRGASSNSLEVTIHSPATPVPRQWQKYISYAKNKINLCAFLAEAWCEIGKEKLEEGQRLCSSLSGFHTLTGCDSTSSFYDIGKKKAWNAIEKNSELQAAFL